MASPPITIKPIEQPFDVTFPDVERGIPPIPGSKSLTNRALLLAALAEGTSSLTGVLFSDDTQVMMKALQDLGFTLDIDEPNHTVTVQGQAGKIPATKAGLHLGNAGTAMRFLTAACCLGDPGSEYTLDGIPRMRERPIGELVEPLCELGAKIEYLSNEGYPPLRIHACGLAGGELKIKPTISSQFISALLMCGPYMSNAIHMYFVGPVTSQPYVFMTTSIMKSFGVGITQPQEHKEGLNIKCPKDTYAASNYLVEPDASNASYFWGAAAAVAGSSCKAMGIHTLSPQGDRYFINELGRMGAVPKWNKVYEEYFAAISSSPSSRLRGFTEDLNHIPDAAMTIATLAILADGPTTIRNVGNWRVKETDRMAAMQRELTKLGATVEIHGDDITIIPPKDNKITPAAIDTYDDHRMAMAFAVIGLAQPGVTINNPDCVNKTFPDFFKYLDYLRQPPV